MNSGAGFAVLERPLAQALADLDRLLGEAGLEAELCVVGGALMPVVFRSQPGTRRPKAMFASLTELTERASAIGREAGLDDGWLRTASSSLLDPHSSGPEAIEGTALCCFTAAPEYVLAMRCARVGEATGLENAEVKADVRYLARLLDLRGPQEVLKVVQGFFPERQLPDDLGPVLSTLFR